MAAFLYCPLPLSSSLQPPKLSVINSKRSFCDAHIPKVFRIGCPGPSLSQQPISCCTLSSQSEPQSSPSTGVFIKGLPQSTAEGRLKKVFSQFGEIKHVNVVRERVTKQSLGSAFVWFDHEESAQLAVKVMNGKCLDCPKIRGRQTIQVLIRLNLSLPFPGTHTELIQTLEGLHMVQYYNIKL